MIKNKTILEVKSGEFTFQLEVAANSPIGSVYDALAQMMAFCVQKMQEAQPKKSEEPVEDPKVEVLPTE